MEIPGESNRAQWGDVGIAPYALDGYAVEEIVYTTTYGIRKFE